ncbi:DUF1749 domain-containing protein [Candidatus Roizmanbacteria bacterium]|nr:DUF1749 domain-containing protein [Candidatus Roizmanbacteria bacterium]
MFELVRTKTKDDLYLHGLFLKGDKNKPAIIHTHGFQGDFFTQEFVRAIAKKLHENNTAFMTVQNRGESIESEIYTTHPNKVHRGGANFELLEEAYIDIDAWIKFLQEKGYKDIILQGHSLGTVKSVRYLFEGTHVDKVKKLILLAPFDIIQLAETATKGKWRGYLKVAEQKVKEGKGEETIPKEFLDAPMSYQTYVSHHKPSDLTFMYKFHDKSYEFPVLKKIQLPTRVIVGTKDIYFYPSNPDHPEEAIEIMKKNIKDFSCKLIENADHGYTGKEDEVANEVISFVK